MRLAARTDANQKEIVTVLRKLGCSVWITSGLGKGFPDLICGLEGQNFLFEIKDGTQVPSRQALTPLEKIFFQTWDGQVNIIRSAEEAMQFIFNKRKSP